MKNIYHITHNDADAVGCDVLLRIYYKDNKDITINTVWASNNTVSDKIVETICSIEDSLKIFKNKDEYEVIISDISPVFGSPGYLVLEELMHCKNPNINVLMFDHHKTNPFKSKDVNTNSILDIMSTDENGTPISAAMIMYRYFIHSGNSILDNNYIKKFVSDISRYDTWEWVNNPSELGGEDAVTNIIKYVDLTMLSYELTEHLCGMVKTLDGIGVLNKDMESKITSEHYIPEKYYLMHQSVKSEFNKYMENINEKLRISKSGEYLYGLLICDNSSINMSLVTDKINRDIIPDVLDYIVILYPLTRSLSFRTIKDTVDVSRIASRCYGGGGHQKAAGAKVDISTFVSFLTEYWVSLSYRYINENAPHVATNITADDIINFIDKKRED